LRREGSLNSDPYRRGVWFCASIAWLMLRLYFLSTSQFLAAASLVSLNSNSGFCGLKHSLLTIVYITSSMFDGQVWVFNSVDGRSCVRALSGVCAVAMGFADGTKICGHINGESKLVVSEMFVSLTITLSWVSGFCSANYHPCFIVNVSV
jgi:hypothetical protein